MFLLLVLLLFIFFKTNPQHLKFVRYIADEILFVHKVTINHHNPRMIIFRYFFPSLVKPRQFLIIPLKRNLPVCLYK